MNSYSGNNGINTVFQVGTPGVLPTFASAATTQISILPGFSTTLANSKTGTVYYPFGIWFANPTTLYVDATAAAGETFKVLRTAESGTVLRGVSFAPLGLPFFTHF